MPKFIIISTFGRDNIERATLAWVMANASVTLDAEITIFLQGEAVNVVRKDYIDGWVSHPFSPLSELVHNFLQSGGKIYVCDPCMKARFIKEEDLIEGAEIAAAVTLLTESIDATVFTY